MSQPGRQVGAPPALELEDLGCRFGDVVALDGVSLTVPPGALLLASVFLSGLILDLGLFVPVVQAIGSLMPVSHGISLLQDLMLRGSPLAPWHLPALGAIAAVTFAPAWLLLRRGMAAHAP
jgi:hypothetical protein